jgi:flagellar basal-body rod modification protein FlgD
MISPVAPLPGAASGSPAEAATQMFVRLLVAEVSRQDPLSALDPSQLVTQLAQLSAVGEIEQARAMSQLQAALALVGRSVTARDPQTGLTLQGQVQAVLVGTAGPELEIDGRSIPMDALISVP